MAVAQNGKVWKVAARIHRAGIQDYWLRCGTATETDEGNIILTLDALPLHSEGVFMLFPKDKDKDSWKP